MRLCARSPKVTCDVSEAIPLSILMRAPVELVTRPGSAKHLHPRQAKPPVLLPPWQRQKKPLIVEVVDNDVPQECVSKANVEQVDKAETQKPQQHHSTPAQQVVEQIIASPAESEQNEVVLRNVEPDHDETVPQCVEAEVPTVIHSPTEPQESVQECTDEQAADVPPWSASW